MAVSTGTVTSISTVVTGLAGALGAHTTAATAAATPIAMIKAGVNVPANANLLANMLAQTNPGAANTALAIVANPAEAPMLIGTLETEITTQSNNLLTSLAAQLGL